MKKFLFAGLAFVMILIFGLMTYGAYLNYYGEKKITQRMENRRLFLSGVKVEKRKLIPILRFDIMSLNSDSIADAMSLIDGRIVKVLVRVNEEVAEGQPVCILENNDYALQVKEVESNILEAIAKLNQAQSDYRRYERLWAQEAASKEKVESTKTTLEAAAAEVEALKAKKERLLMQEAALTVTAPISGKVTLIYQGVGTFVKAGTPLILVSDNEKLNFNFPIFDNMASWFPPGSTASVYFLQEDFFKAYDTAFGVGNKGKEQAITAMVVEMDPPLDVPAEIRMAVWEIDNRSGILDLKTYKDVELKSHQTLDCLAVPITAVDTVDQKKPYVLTVGQDDTLEKREVVLGIRDEEYVEITSGLTLGETVITSGRIGLEPGMKVKVNLK